jgi:hypothetical protein
MFNELTERKMREEENGEIFAEGFACQTQGLDLFVWQKGHTDEIISKGKRRNHGLWAAIPDEGTSEAIRFMPVSCVDNGEEKVRKDHGIQIAVGRKI